MSDLLQASSGDTATVCMVFHVWTAVDGPAHIPVRLLQMIQCCVTLCVVYRIPLSAHQLALLGIHSTRRMDSFTIKERTDVDVIWY